MLDYKMNLSPEEIKILQGEKGEIFAKVMKTLVMYGDTFGATKMVDITSSYGHLVTSFGLSMMKPVYELMEKLLEAEAYSSQKFTVDPRPLDFKNVPSNPLQNAVFSFMYSKQEDYEDQLDRMGLIDEDGFTCTCYMEEVGNIPEEGDILSWAESSAVVYANSVLGARCNRNSGIIEMLGSILGKVPYFGLLTDEGRKASWVIDLKTSSLPEAQLLGSAIGMKVLEEVPYIKNLDGYFNKTLDSTAKDYLKDMGAATASNGAVGLFHVEGLTPEARSQGTSLIKEDFKTYIIDDRELERVKESYPLMWKNPSAGPKLCFIGCPHLSLDQLRSWTRRIGEALKDNGRKSVLVDTVLTCSPGVKKEFENLKDAKLLRALGVRVSSICPLMYMNNPLCGNMRVATNSNKLRTYTTSRYYTDSELLDIITGGRE